LLSRFIKILYPLRNHFLMTPRAAHIISKTTWVLLLVPITVYVIQMLITHKRLDSAPNSCNVLSSEQINTFYIFIHITACIIFLSVLLSMVFFSYSASRRVLEAQQRQPAASSSRKLVRSRRNIMVLVSVFCICFIPYHLVQVPYIFLRERHVVVLIYLKEMSVFMSVINICLDPLIYVFLCKNIRAQLNLKQMFSTNGKRDTSTSERRPSESAVQQQHQLTAASMQEVKVAA
ncbi:P2Y purinoceptor 14-like, partial [Nematolebias whitei]|uniref:P2Y purinoceptor 14-like n=1 Tax=Nematolebias whitei TaxID=451745 RepID=UPI00189803F1